MVMVLHRCVSRMSAGCGVCGAEIEDTLHALKRCKLAAVIWQQSSFEEVVEREFACVIDWWEWVRGELSAEEWENFITLAWAVWGARNGRFQRRYALMR